MRDPLNPIGVTIKRILVVEENRQEAEFLKIFLESRRFQVQLARDAGQALTAFRLQYPDFVILEAILPNGDSGYEVCELMKNEKASIPVIMLTVIDMDESRALANRVGVDAYLTKPYDPEELLNQITLVSKLVWNRSLRPPQPTAENAELIRFSCAHCGKNLKAKFVNRGRTLSCPQCGQPVVIPLS